MAKRSKTSTDGEDAATGEGAGAADHGGIVVRTEAMSRPPLPGPKESEGEASMTLKTLVMERPAPENPLNKEDAPKANVSMTFEVLSPRRKGKKPAPSVGSSYPQGRG